jgi:hypothetical protein
MEFRVQEILKNIIPGIFFIILCSWIVFMQSPMEVPLTIPSAFKDLSEVVLVVFLALSYVLGFLLDAISSIFEGLLYEFINVPSHTLFHSEVNRYSLANKDKIIEILCAEQGVEVPVVVTNDHAIALFKTANLLKDKNPSELLKEKIIEYYNAYIFSRNLMSVLIVSLCIDLIMLYKYSFGEHSLIIICSLIILLSFITIRWRSRAFYYCRQVLYGACYLTV